MQLRDGRLALLVDAGLDGQLRSHFPELVRRLAGLRHPLSESALVRASELERLFAREIVDTAAR